MKLKNWEWDEVAVELECQGDEAAALANKIWDEMDDDGATTMTIEGLSEEEEATIQGVLQIIRMAQAGWTELRAAHESAEAGARVADAAAREASAAMANAPTISQLREVEAHWADARRAWQKADRAGNRVDGDE